MKQEQGSKRQKKKITTQQKKSRVETKANKQNNPESNTTKNKEYFPQATKKKRFRHKNKNGVFEDIKGLKRSKTKKNIKIPHVLLIL